MEDFNLRKFIDLFEYASFDEPAPIEAIAPPQVDVSQRLIDILFKLRSHTDIEGGDFSTGFESGLEMAASMIENLLKSMGEEK